LPKQKLSRNALTDALLMATAKDNRLVTGCLTHALRRSAPHNANHHYKDKHMRILLAEDDSVLADGLTRSLRQSHTVSV